ncbi:MAG: CoB--CoM heterodisulfide reductase iron-sulfur subunit A family protein, partial [bacterium]|nr:CoB--CoM heterodisulfide reductase iron-sulfur subunit A family protein [bacterium]
MSSKPSSAPSSSSPWPSTSCASADLAEFSLQRKVNISLGYADPEIGGIVALQVKTATSCAEVSSVSDRSGDVVVIGAGPAGLEAAVTLAAAGRNVTLVEKSPILGGQPMRYETAFPTMQSAPGLLGPLVGEVVRSPNIELHTLAEVTGVSGSFGSFTVKIRREPRYVDTQLCTGCGDCIPPCPATVANQRKAIDFAVTDSLPDVPYIDMDACLRSLRDDCAACREACPVEGAIEFDDTGQTVECTAGAIVVAVGFDLFDVSSLPGLSHGKMAGVYTSLEFERVLAPNGPTGGQLRTPDGAEPATVAIVHCVGSLDTERQPYCSRVCCSEAFKLGHLIEKKLPDALTFHFHKGMVEPGKDDLIAFTQATRNPGSTFIRYGCIAELDVALTDGQKRIHFRDAYGMEGELNADLVVLCPAMTPAPDSEKLARTLGVSLDRFGFFEKLAARPDLTQSNAAGIYLAGTCRWPMDIRGA